MIETLVFDKAQITCKWNYSVPKWGGACHPLTSACGEAIVIIKSDMQATTGTLSPGAHPGSYNGQDAYNDMLITEYGVFNSANRRIQTIRSEQHSCPKGLQECDRPNNRGGIEKI